MNNGVDLMQLMQAASQQSHPAHKDNMNYFSWLSIVLVILKGMGYISCSWIWVFFPFVLPYVFLGIIAVIGICVSKIKKK